MVLVEGYPYRGGELAGAVSVGCRDLGAQVLALLHQRQQLQHLVAGGPYSRKLVPPLSQLNLPLKLRVPCTVSEGIRGEYFLW